MANLSPTLLTTLEKMESAAAHEPFKQNDVNRLRLELERDAESYPCLRCENASWQIGWLPPSTKQNRDFGIWLDPIHVGCKAFLTLQQNESNGCYLRRSQDTYFCTAEVNSAIGNATIYENQFNPASSSEKHSQQSVIKRESNRG